MAMHVAGIMNASANSTFACRVEDSPRVKIAVTTNDIEYDNTHGARDLTALKTDTKSPYPPGSDTVTGGLRHDHPTIHTRMQWDIVWEDRNNMGCMRYETIDIEIHLQPKIFLAKEFDHGACRDACWRMNASMCRSTAR